MPDLKLSDINPEDIQLSNQQDAQPSADQQDTLKLSDVNPEDVQSQSLAHAISVMGQKGLTGGLTDVAAGAGAAAGTLAGGKKGLLDRVKAYLKGDDTAFEDIKKAYQEGLLGQKQIEDAAETAHPVAGKAAELAGTLATMGAGATRLGKLGMTSPVRQMATMGGLTGATSYLGSTPDPTLLGTAGSTALGTGLGALGMTKAGQGAMLGGTAAYLGSKALGGEGSTSDLATGAGATAGLLAGLATRKLSPASLEVLGSRIAEDLVKLDPRKQIPGNYDEIIGRYIKNYQGTKGLGKTVSEQGAVPFFGGMRGIAQAAQDATSKNFQELNPLLKSTQNLIDKDVQGSIEQAGDFGSKMSKEYYDFVNNNKLDDQNAQELLSTYKPEIEDLSNSDGNIVKLTQLKRDLYNQATDKNKNIYLAPDKVKVSNEAKFLSDLARVAKERIEDLAGTVDPNAQKQIQTLNNNISKLITYQQAADKQLAPVSIGLSSKIMNLATKIPTGYTPEQLGQVLSSKAALGASKIGSGLGTAAETISNIPGAKGLGAVFQPKLAPVSTGVAPSTQQTIQDLFKSKPAEPQSSITAPEANVAQSAGSGMMASPFSKQNINKSYNPTEATKLTAQLSNASNDQLKQISQQLRTTPVISGYSDILDKAIQEDDLDAKNRAIFLISQNPSSRMVAKDILGEEV